MIQLDNVSKMYGSVIGVNDITLSLDGGAWGLLGPNGSGKTTLINLILGQLKPSIGSVKLFGKNPWRRSGLLREIGYCPAAEISWPSVSSLEWITYMVQMHGFGRSAARERARQSLCEVKLDHVMHRPINQYSLGMRQRTKIAQAIAHEPQLLILDEPFNGLDPVGRFEMTDFLRRWREQGRSLILASHILHEIEAVHPSFLLIYGGRLMASGSPDEVHQILDSGLTTITMRTNQPSQAAGLLLQASQSGAAEIESVRRVGDDTVELETTKPEAILHAINELVQHTDIVIEEITSSDRSLQSLFRTLLKVHRGEQQRRATA